MICRMFVVKRFDPFQWAGSSGSGLGGLIVKNRETFALRLMRHGDAVFACRCAAMFFLPGEVGLESGLRCEVANRPGRPAVDFEPVDVHEIGIVTLL